MTTAFDIISFLRRQQRTRQVQGDNVLGTKSLILSIGSWEVIYVGYGACLNVGLVVLLLRNFEPAFTIFRLPTGLGYGALVLYVYIAFAFPASSQSSLSLNSWYAGLGRDRTTYVCFGALCIVTVTCAIQPDRFSPLSFPTIVAAILRTAQWLCVYKLVSARLEQDTVTSAN